MERQETGPGSNCDRSARERERILLSAIFGKASEVESKPELEKPDIFERYAYTDDFMLIAFHFEGKAYRRTVPIEIAFEFSEWLAEYAAVTERCADCHELLFPEELLSAEDGKLSHYNYMCSSKEPGYMYDFKGKLVPLQFKNPS